MGTVIEQGAGLMLGDVSFFAPLTMVIVAGLLGALVAWLRPELDLSPRSTGLAAATAALVPALLFATGAGPQHQDLLILFAGLSPLVIIDARRMILPDQITLPLIALGIFAGIAIGLDAGLARLIGAAIGFGLFWLVGTVWFRWKEVDGLGLGDAKLFSAIGAFFGWQALAEVALVGAIFAIGLTLVWASSDRSAPFGPGLAVGALVWWALGPLL